MDENKLTQIRSEDISIAFESCWILVDFRVIDSKSDKKNLTVTSKQLAGINKSYPHAFFRFVAGPIEIKYSVKMTRGELKTQQEIFFSFTI